MKLSEHFSLEELTASEIAERKNLNNTPNASEILNLTRLAAFLEKVRSILGTPIIINSAFRSKAVNDAVGSKDSSQHRIGCAADIRTLTMKPDQICRAIINSDLKYDQLIREFDSWVHISIPNTQETEPRQQSLIIDRSGTRPYK